MRILARQLIAFIDVAWPILLLFVLWQFWIVAARVSPIVAPAPSAVVSEVLRNPSLYVSAAIATIVVAVIGIASGTVVAIMLAIIVWMLPFAGTAITLPALLVQSTPLIVLLPLLARLLGYGQATVFAAATIITFLPTFVLISSGLRAVPAGSEFVFTALGSSRIARLRRLALPASIPSLLVALRISAAGGVLAALTAEYLTGGFGLGSVISDAQVQLMVARAWAASLIATAFSVGAFAAAQRLEVFGRRFVA